jgi:hypothetical protein
MPNPLKSPPRSGEPEILGSAPSVRPVGADASGGADPSVAGLADLAGVQPRRDAHGFTRPRVAGRLHGHRGRRSGEHRRVTLS